MNNDRRIRILAAASFLDFDFEEAIGRIEAIRDDERDAFDNMPESLQDGERGQTSEEAQSALEEALSALEDARNSVEEALSRLEDARA